MVTNYPALLAIKLLATPAIELSERLRGVGHDKKPGAAKDRGEMLDRIREITDLVCAVGYGDDEQGADLLRADDRAFRALVTLPVIALAWEVAVNDPTRPTNGNSGTLLYCCASETRDHLGWLVEVCDRANAVEVAHAA